MRGRVGTIPLAARPVLVATLGIHRSSPSIQPRLAGVGSGAAESLYSRYSIVTTPSRIPTPITTAP